MIKHFAPIAGGKGRLISSEDSIYMENCEIIFLSNFNCLRLRPFYKSKTILLSGKNDLPFWLKMASEDSDGERFEKFNSPHTRLGEKP